MPDAFCIGFAGLQVLLILSTLQRHNQAEIITLPSPLNLRLHIHQ